MVLDRICHSGSKNSIIHTRMKTLLAIIPVFLLASCSSGLNPMNSEGRTATADFFDNKRPGENMDYSIKLLEDMQRENGSGHIIFWQFEGREYFTAMRQVRPGQHYGPNPSRGYYHAGREVVNVTKDTIPWSRILSIRSKI
jgi:hypothetical protein